VNLLSVLFGLLYPCVVFVGLKWLSPRILALAIGSMLLMRAIVKFRGAACARLVPLASPAVLIAGPVGLAALLDDGRYFKLLPVIVNVGLLLAFTRTLQRGPSMVERLARAHYQTLAPGASLYCRRVTVVWCVFFALNSAILFWLAVRASLAVWTLYAGFLAYVVVAVIFAVEMVYRAWSFRHYEDGLIDVILRRIFPPRVRV
jgi:uncharacterized membrane protein